MFLGIFFLFFWNFMKWGLKGGISIDADSGPPRYVLWCCGGIYHQPDTFIKIGCGHTVLVNIFERIELIKIILFFSEKFQTNGRNGGAKSWKEARPYQIELLKKALKQNSIVYLGTGAGKTFIATMMIKEKMSAILHDNKKTVFLKAKLNRKRIFIFVRIADLKAPNYLWKITSLELKYENIN